MKVLVTGGLGFLGQVLTRKLLALPKDGEDPVSEIVLVDRTTDVHLHGTVGTDPRVTTLAMDIADPTVWDTLIDEPGMMIYHMAAVMSGQGEQDFDLCMNVNLQGFMHLLERARKIGQDGGKICKVLFCSTGAVFGPLRVVTDDTKTNPETTYGMTKAASELLLNEYTRKGFVDGRAARLPTIIVRPGKPNGASTSCYSGVVREPLNGVDIVLPVHDTLQHACGSYNTVMDGIVKLATLPIEVIEEKLGKDRVINLPSFSATLKDLGDAVYRVAKSHPKTQGQRLGRIDSSKPDERLNKIVGSMMNAMEYPRATALGIKSNPPVDDIIREYIEEFWSPPKPQVRNVGFVGIGFMGSGMVRNLAKAGLEVFIFNRTTSKAEAVAAGLDNVHVVNSPAAVAKKTSVLCMCLASEAQTDNCMFDENVGFHKELSADHIVIDHSTVSTACTMRIFKACKEKGARFLDAPISGGPEGAAAGTLSIMCGGDEDSFQAVLPVLQAMGRKIELMGPVGAGTATKLVNQQLVGVHATVTTEALQLAKRLGITNVRKLVDLLMVSWGQSKMVERCGGVIADVEEKQDPSIIDTSGAPVRNVFKDLQFVKAAATGVSLNTPVTDAALAQYQDCMDNGLSESDIAAPYNRL